MAIQRAFKGDVNLIFKYRASKGSNPISYEIPSERISYVMVEHLYENRNVLPVVYVNINLTSDIYDKVMNGTENSKFHLRLRKKDGLASTAVYKVMVDDEFSYVTSTSNPNYAVSLDSQGVDAYKGLMVGLVSSNMTNTLRTSFNGVYRNTNTEALVNIALDGMKSIVKAPIVNIQNYDQFMVPPLASRYKMLEYIFENYPFYNSEFTFYMDFDKTYLIPRNGAPVASNNGPDSIIVNVKDYTAEEAYVDGFSIQNGAYVVYVNAADTKMIIDNSVSKVTNNIVSYNDDFDSDPQTFQVDNESVSDNTEKTTFVRMDHAGMLKQNLESNTVMIELLKQNLDGDIFTPNMSFNVSNYGEYSKFNGRYYLAYKRVFFAISTGGEFTITTNVGLKRAGDEVPKPLMRSYKSVKKSKSTSSSATTTTTSNGGSSTSRSTTRSTISSNTKTSTRVTTR